MLITIILDVLKAAKAVKPQKEKMNNCKPKLSKDIYYNKNDRSEKMNVNKYEFRKLNKEEFCKASDLIWSVFNEFEAPEYSKEGIYTFKEFINSDRLYENSEKGFMNFYACFHQEKLIGIIASRESCHISLLFVKKEYHHKGIARELFNKLKMEIIENNPNTRCITVNSSPFAVYIYMKLGFIPTDEEQIRDGLRFTPMKYVL